MCRDPSICLNFVDFVISEHPDARSVFSVNLFSWSANFTLGPRF